MVTLIALLLSHGARAESASTLPAGGRVVYGGVGVTTFEYGSAAIIRDRQYRARLDLFAAAGLTERWELRAALPVFQTWVQEHADRGPCPSSSDYCDPTTGAGEAYLAVRRQLVSSSVKLAAEAGGFTDIWNAQTRSRWTNVGQGTWGGTAALLLGGQLPAGTMGFVAQTRYTLVVGRQVDGSESRLPSDGLGGGIEGWAQRGKLRAELGLSGFTRLGGIPYGSEWVSEWLGSEDRWAALQYREIVARGKLSVSLSESTGLHISAGRVLWAWSGPKDALDVGVGVHKYWSAAPRSH